MSDEEMKFAGTNAEDREESLMKELDRRLVLALEGRPEVAVPPGFAARVAAQAPARRPVLLRTTHYGQRAMVLCLPILAAVVLALAAHNIGHTAIGLTIECLLYAQLVLLAMWLGIRWQGLRSIWTRRGE